MTKQHTDQIDISYFAKTKAEAVDFANQISAISNAAYQNGFQLDKILNQTFGMQKKEKFISLLREQGITTDSIQELKTILGKIQETALSLPVLSLTLAFQPNEQTLDTLSRWFLLNIKKQLLFDISVDPRLIAGIAISFQGKYVDFSVKERFAKIILDMLHPPAQTPTSQPVKQPIHHNPDNIHL